MRKEVIIVNGGPGSGKTTFQNILSNKIQTTVFSSIDPVKEIYQEYMGWDGNKSEEDRRVLSGLKRFLNEETNILNNIMLSVYEVFGYSDKQLLSIDIREIEEIKKYKEEFQATTVLVVNPNVPKIASNQSDLEAFNEAYEYDFIIDNSGEIEELETIADEFLTTLFNS